MFPFYFQEIPYSCGPTCLQMIAKYYGRELNIKYLCLKIDTNIKGISIYTLCQTAKEIGFNSLAVNITFNKLISHATMPCIVFWPSNHFVVLTPDTDKHKVTIADPSTGIFSLPKLEFIAIWGIEKYKKGNVILLEPTSKFYKL